MEAVVLLVMSLNDIFFGDVFEWLFFALVMYLEENKFGNCPSICNLIKWLLLDSFSY